MQKNTWKICLLILSLSFSALAQNNNVRQALDLNNLGVAQLANQKYGEAMKSFNQFLCVTILQRLFQSGNGAFSSRFDADVK